jgi:hypothetical protein
LRPYSPTDDAELEYIAEDERRALAALLREELKLLEGEAE